MNQPHSAMTNTRKRRVTINETVQCVEILSIYDYTPSEISAAWFDEAEMDQITQRCFKVLQRMECGTASKNGQKYCTRGLEGHSLLGSIGKKKARSAAVMAVLEEQARQWNENTEIDVQAISDAYTKTTSSCLLWAQVVGNRDRQAVEAYLYPDDDEEEDEAVDTTAAVASIKAPRDSVLTKTPSQRRIQNVSKTAGMIQKSARAA